MQSKKTSASEAKSTSQTNGMSRDAVASTLKKETVFEVSTDDDDDDGTGNQLDEDGLPVLPDFFGQSSFLLSGKFKDRRTLVRYIVAYNGYVRCLYCNVLCNGFYVVSFFYYLNAFL